MSVHSFVSPSFSVLFTKEREKRSNNIKIAILVSDVDKIVKVKGVPVGEQVHSNAFLASSTNCKFPIRKL